MDNLNDLEVALEGNDLNAAKEALDTICTKLGYRRLAKCHCSDKSRYRFKSDKWKCSTILECFHYGNKSFASLNRSNEGVIFSIESFTASILPEYKNQLAVQYNRQRRRSGMSLLETGYVFAEKVVSEEKLRSIECNVYGEKWNRVAGKEISTDFDCKKTLIFVESFGNKLEIPPVVKTVNIKQIVEEVLKFQT